MACELTTKREDEVKKEIKAAIDTLKAMAANCKEGDRHICVLDRGWIFCGNLTRTEDGINTLTNVVNVRKWARGGFGLASTDPKAAGVEVDDCATIRFRDSALMFAVPVSENWNE